MGKNTTTKKSYKKNTIKTALSNSKKLNLYKTGRPPKYKTAKELQLKIEEYFQVGRRVKTIVLKCGDALDLPILTITGLSLYLGFESRQAFYHLEKKEKFSYTIKRARSFIEQEYESQLQSNNCTGAIFALKNFGWKDKQEFEHSGKLENEITYTKDTALAEVISMQKEILANGKNTDGAIKKDKKEK